MALPVEARRALRQARTEQAEWEAVYAEMLPRIFHYFCYRVGDSRAAEDLTSETFERAWRRRRRFRRDLGAFSNWLFGIARRVAAEEFRRARRAAQRGLVAGAGGPDAGQPARDRSHPSAEAVAQHNSEFARLAALLSDFPERERELVALKYGAELTNRAIAALTGLSESNVGTILHRVLGRLRARWEVDDG